MDLLRGKYKALANSSLVKKNSSVDDLYMLLAKLVAGRLPAYFVECSW